MASGEDEQRSGLAEAAGRAAFFPARAAARAWREQLEAAVDEMLSAPEIARVIDRALAGPLPEEIARSVVRHRVLERVVGELVASGELERLLSAALASPQTLELTDRALASEETQHALRAVASSPEVRHAIARQTTGLADEVADSVRASAVRLDERVEHAVSRRKRLAPPLYGGIVTRALALAADAVLVTALHMLVVGVVALVTSLVGDLHPGWLVGALLAVSWTVIAGLYFVLFWSAAGQTPGMRLLGLRVHTTAGGVPSVGRSIVRMVGLVLSIALLFVGFVPVLFDERRRGLADFIAGTSVLTTMRSRSRSALSTADRRLRPATHTRRAERRLLDRPTLVRGPRLIPFERAFGHPVAAGTDVLGRSWLGRHGFARGASSRRFRWRGRPASSCLLRFLERFETFLERRHTTVKRIDRPQPAGDIMDALLDPVHHPTRSLDKPSERVLADVGKLRDHVPVVRVLLLCHSLTIAPLATRLDEGGSVSRLLLDRMKYAVV